MNKTISNIPIVLFAISWIMLGIILIFGWIGYSIDQYYRSWRMNVDWVAVWLGWACFKYMPIGNHIEVAYRCVYNNAAYGFMFIGIKLIIFFAVLIILIAVFFPFVLNENTRVKYK
jgi:hypothetical protein